MPGTFKCLPSYYSTDLHTYIAYNGGLWYPICPLKDNTSNLYHSDPFLGFIYFAHSTLMSICPIKNFSAISCLWLKAK